jgi:hypothetical protein
MSSVNGREELSSSSSLEEPLLPRGRGDRCSAEGNQVSAKNATTTTGGSCWTVPLGRIKLLSLVTGALIAVASQLLLGQIMWKPAHAAHNANSAAAVYETPRSTREIVVFSLLWSFFTCVMIFGSLAIFVRCICRFCLHHQRPSEHEVKMGIHDSTAASNQPRIVDLDGDLFQIEAHHIVGSLLSISFIWILVDICQSISKKQKWQNGLGLPSLHQDVVYMVIAAAWYAIFVRCIMRKSSNTKAKDGDATGRSGSIGGLMSTYQMIAATLGLISGLCSQFLLSFVLWTDHMTKPVIENVVVFSLLWSVCSVILTFVGCVSLRLLTLDEASRISAERIFLRMESHFIFCSLIGICMAWILIDLIMDMREQIVPSILMLAASLLAFCGIVACFPEDKCLADLQDLELTETASTSVSSDGDTSPVIQVV